MPRGGYRPGSGGKAGNNNRLKHGRASDRSLMLIRLFHAHPYRREIVRHLYLEGILHLGLKPTEADMQPGSPLARRLLRFLDSVFFDRTDPLFHQFDQFDQTSESAIPPGEPLPRFTKAEREEIKVRSNNRRLRFAAEAKGKARRRKNGAHRAPPTDH